MWKCQPGNAFDVELPLNQKSLFSSNSTTEQGTEPKKSRKSPSLCIYYIIWCHMYVSPTHSQCIMNNFGSKSGHLKISGKILRFSSKFDEFTIWQDFEKPLKIAALKLEIFTEQCGRYRRLIWSEGGCLCKK